MYPILFQIGPFSLHSLWLFVSIACVVGILVFAKIAKRQRLNLSMFFNNSLLVALTTLLVSRLTFYLMNLQFYMPTFRLSGLLRFFYIWDKGLSFWGALLGFAIILALLCFKRGESILKWMDTLVIPIGIGIIIANFGQLLDGQGYGSPTNMPWGITYESINVKYTVPIHPTQIYSMLYIAAILYFLRKYKKHPLFEEEGSTTLTAIFIYALIRFLVEFLRGDDTAELFNIRVATLISAIIFLIAGSFLYKRYKNFKQGR